MAGSSLTDVLFARCKLDAANLRMPSGARLEILDSHLRGADLYAAELAGSRMYDCDLSSVQLSHAVLDQVRLHGSHLRNINGVTALQSAVISQDQLMDMAMALFDASGITIDDDR